MGWGRDCDASVSACSKGWPRDSLGVLLLWRRRCHVWWSADDTFAGGDRVSYCSCVWCLDVGRVDDGRWQRSSYSTASVEVENIRIWWPRGKSSADVPQSLYLVACDGLVHQLGKYPYMQKVLSQMSVWLLFTFFRHCHGGGQERLWKTFWWGTSLSKVGIVSLPIAGSLYKLVILHVRDLLIPNSNVHLTCELCISYYGKNINPYHNMNQLELIIIYVCSMIEKMSCPYTTDLSFTKGYKHD
jgi:hypothetical protein